MNNDNINRFKNNDNYNLLELLRDNSPFASDEEQREFDKLDIDKLMKSEFEELTLDEL